MYDVIVIGGGPGGNPAAVRLSKYGKKVAVVERDSFGGTCLNRGCIPTKTLLHSSRMLEELRSGAQFGVLADNVKVDYAALRSRKDLVFSTLREGSENRLVTAGVDIFRGTAFVTAPGKVSVTEPDGSVKELSGENIIIAAGARPMMPQIGGAGLPGVYTSDKLLEKLPELRSLTIIGGGVIGVEFASIYHGFGADVTILEAQPRILPTIDRELSQSLTLTMKQKGIAIISGAAVDKIEEAQNGLVCTYTAKGESFSVSSDAMLIAVGRSPNSEGLFAPSCTPHLDHGFITTDEKHCSSIPGIFAIGDIAAGGPQLAHAASGQAAELAAGLAGVPCMTDASLVPVCVYSDPEIATVGLSETEAKKRGLSIKTAKQPMTGNGMNLASGGDRGYIRLVCGEDDKILGAQLFCGHATEFIGEIALAISNGLTSRQFAGLVRPHPTFEESLSEAAGAVAASAVRKAR